ncbi:carbohydrate diacid transcriptional activator CdaR [Bhargavaea cecembensis DSE10]|uniref:Carbohydrate diacid transcriptional activator CdaR n=1 Tax=Bhargavaea cecembensis DSE10 TaxID=1235279 RepID=M7NCH4_9BACL|nr:helix-turn-helix domain-containing protein [Bhargavaea cecembensis]EMR04967.1 carbohydrate diacid transcriptional activator CdaR [Bhargavaea cecembensis DSE10]
MVSKSQQEHHLSSARAEAVINVANAVNSTLELDELFELTLSESIRAIPDADGGALFLFDQATRLLLCRAYVNFDEKVEQIRLLPGESFTGDCFKMRKPILLADRTEITGYPRQMRPENKQLLNHSMAMHPSNNSYRAMSVPLITAKGECIGVMTLNGFAEKGTFTVADVELLETIAGLAATALERATLYEDIKIKNNTFKTMLNYQQEQLVNMNSGLGLDVMLGQLFSVVRKPLSLLTVYGEVFNTAGIPEHDRPANEYLIRDGRQLLGKLLIYANGHPVPKQTDDYFIQQSLLYFALEINRQAAVRQVEQRYKTELMDHLLNGMLSDGFLVRAERLGLDTSGVFLPAAVGIADDQAERSIDQLIRQNEIAGFLEMEISRTFPGSLMIVRDSIYLLILAVSPETHYKDSFRRLSVISEATCRFLHDHNPDLYARFGIGKLVQRIEELPDSLQNAMVTLKMMEDSKHGERIADSSHFLLERLIDGSSVKEVESFVTTFLGPLHTYDKEKGTELAKTLKAYCRNLQRPGNAAKELHIHPNTLQYRIKQISRLLDSDLTDPETLLNLQLACRLAGV